MATTNRIKDENNTYPFAKGIFRIFMTIILFIVFFKIFNSLLVSFSIIFIWGLMRFIKRSFDSQEVETNLYHNPHKYNDDSFSYDDDLLEIDSDGLHGDPVDGLYKNM